MLVLGGSLQNILNNLILRIGLRHTHKFKQGANRAHTQIMCTIVTRISRFSCAGMQCHQSPCQVGFPTGISMIIVLNTTFQGQTKLWPSAVVSCPQHQLKHTYTCCLSQERPDAILPTMGGQTGLNLAKNLAEVGDERWHDSLHWDLGSFGLHTAATAIGTTSRYKKCSHYSCT